MLRDHLERRRVKKTFGNLVEPEVVDRLLDGKSPAPSLTASDIEFVLVSVRFETPRQVSEMIGRVVEICSRHQASVDGVSGSIVVAAFGVQPHATTKPGAAVDLASELIRDLGPDVRIVHGSGPGFHGCLGSGKSLRFSFILRGFDSSLALLDKTEFGTMQKFKPLT
jgi:hypothetical protein